VAFTGEYDGTPTSSSFPLRRRPSPLTHHPDADTAIGWTRTAAGPLHFVAPQLFAVAQLFTVAVEAIPVPFRCPREHGFLLADGKRLAYVPKAQWQRSGSGTRAGRLIPSGSSTSPASRSRRSEENSNDFNPMWIEDKVYFLSDRKGAYRSSPMI